VLAGLAPARRRLVLGLVGVVVLAVVAGVVSLVLRRGETGGAADQSRPGPVLLVPGYGGDVSDLDPLADALRAEGRTVRIVAPTQGGTGDLRVQARRLASAARAAMSSSGASSVDVVGYSAGGVIARLYVADDGGRSVVRRVLTLGSPHHGTDVAALAQDAAGGCPTACEQLATGSDLLRRLDAGDETPSGPLWTTVRTTSDKTVVPTDSAELSGALNVVVQDVCPGSTTSHGALPGDPVVLALLPVALGTEPPSAPTGVSC
jgi:triacylglycerol lipase